MQCELWFHILDKIVAKGWFDHVFMYFDHVPYEQPYISCYHFCSQNRYIRYVYVSVHIVVTEDPEDLIGLQYEYSIRDGNYQICQEWEGDQDWSQYLRWVVIEDTLKKRLNTVVCENNQTPMMQKFRIVKSSDITISDIKLIQAKIFAAGRRRVSLSLFSSFNVVSNWSFSLLYRYWIVLYWIECLIIIYNYSLYADVFVTPLNFTFSNKK